jgi:hypothetical protein
LSIFPPFFGILSDYAFLGRCFFGDERDVEILRRKRDGDEGDSERGKGDKGEVETKEIKENQG